MAKKGVYKISGNATPKVLEKTIYNVVEWYPETPLTERNSKNITWELFRKSENGFISTNIKKKGIGEFTFGKKAHQFTYKVEGYLHEPEGKSPMSIIVQPQENNDTPKRKEKNITDVLLSYEDGSKITKTLSYKDRLKASARCDGMEGERIIFKLWEDDQEKAGHNKNNQFIAKSPPVEVNKYGKASYIFPLYSTYISIANKREDDKKKHEYYITAEYNGKLDASQNVNVNNPEYKQPAPKTISTPKTKVSPKKDTPKFPSSSSGKRQSDSKGKITNAEFVDGHGNKLSKSKIGNHVSVKITSQDMKDKVVVLRIWEDDTIKDDLLFEKRLRITKDVCFYNNLLLTKAMYEKGHRSEIEGDLQEYYIEIEHLDISTESSRINVGLEEEPKMQNLPKSTAIVKPQQTTKEKSCFCQEHLKDLIWGGKVSCEFRKKVVEIAKRLGKDPNLLMAGMALETGRTFSPTAGSGTSYVGLIQFGDDAAKSVGTTRSELLKMTAVKQLDYVEKYLEKKKNKINTLTDFYLSILMPVDVGKGNQPNHVIFDNQYPLVYKENGKLTDLSKSRHYGYRQNPSFFYEEGEKKKWENGGKRKYDGPGKTYVWEIEKNITKFYEEGKLNKAKIFECKKNESAVKPSLDNGTWNIVITEKYTGSKCTHLERTKIRPNCRRGKIEVYDHNQKIVMTFTDCLLEGIAGEDHMKTNSDVPFGEFQINQTTPFYHSNKDNKVSYGPNPRLVFEPIKGNNDEAAKSGRSAIRIHGGRQEGYATKTLKRTQGCIRVWDNDAKSLYDWWVDYSKNNPNVKPGKVTIKK